MPNTASDRSLSTNASAVAMRQNRAKNRKAGRGNLSVMVDRAFLQDLDRAKVALGLTGGRAQVLEAIWRANRAVFCPVQAQTDLPLENVV
jgi:hypothetical protein